MFPRNRLFVKFFIRGGFALVFTYLLVSYFGLLTHLFEQSFKESFHYPFDGDVLSQCYLIRHGQQPEVAPVNNQTFTYRRSADKKCMDEFGKSPLNPHLLIVVKSKIDNFERRTAIRNSWGFEKRFSDVLIRTVFSLGIDQKTHDGEPSALQKLVDVEADRFGDIVQFNFIDAYFNNTLKTVNNMRWCKEFCIRSKFFLFVDDDFYVSIKNVLSFLRNPVDYPEYLEEYKEQLRKLNQRRILTANGSSSIAASSSRNLLNLNMELPAGVKLFSGFVFNSAPHRHKSSKWYVSLEEYPYDMWPSYVTAGSFVMSREALSEMYCASMYTKHFRFDDIFLGIVAMKARIQPLHSEEFYFYKATYNGPASYRYVLASHGYDNPDEMVKVWNEVRSNGYA